MAATVPRLRDLVVELDDAARAAKHADQATADAWRHFLEVAADADVAHQRYRRAIWQYEANRGQAIP